MSKNIHVDCVLYMSKVRVGQILQFTIFVKPLIMPSQALVHVTIAEGRVYMTTSQAWKYG